MTALPGTARTRNPEATRARLLAAATEEFSAHGIAGARIDRIEAAARANRALIYSHFGSKDGLFDAVMDAAVARVLAEVPFTQYMVVSTICNIPWTIAFIVLGQGIFNGNFKMVVYGMGVIIVATVIVQAIRKRYVSKPD